MMKIEGRIIRLEDYAKAKRSKKSLSEVDFSSLTGKDFTCFDSLDFREMTELDCRRVVARALSDLEDRKLKRKMEVLCTRDLIMAVVVATFPIETVQAILPCLEIDRRRRSWTAGDVRAILDHLPRPAVEAYLRFLDTFIAERADEGQE